MKKAYGMTVLMLLLTTVLSLGWATEGSARPGDLATFNSTYDTAGTRLDSCLVCHVDGSDLNPFGMDISMQTGTTGQRLANVEVLDSDGDGFSNIDEINNLTFPGDPDDNPAVGPEAAPDGLAALSFAIAVIIALFAILSAAAYLASRMKEANLRKWHRYAGVILAPLIVLQALSGIFLSLDWLLGYHHRVGETVREDVPPLAVIWDQILVEIHYGLGIPGAIEHIALGVGLVWATISGAVIFFRIRSRKKRLKRPPAKDT